VLCTLTRAAVVSHALKSRSGGFGIGFSVSPELCNPNGTTLGSVSRVRIL
jgi:hypothetical protein